MKILYKGFEDEGLTYMGEYEVLRSIPRPEGTGYVVTDDNGTETFIQPHNAIPMVPMPGTSGNWGEKHWGNREEA